MSRISAVFAVNGGQFVLIQPGTFQMGSTDGDSDERPVHTVSVTKAFYLQKTEVTQAQWEAVMGSNSSEFKGDPQRPVENVSWDDAQAFVEMLNGRIPGGGFRLPTEAEWEYACRAGTTGDYGGTGRLEDMGWYEHNSGGTTHPVGLKLASAWGLYDMHGNVWEWCQDWHDDGYYKRSPESDPVGPSRGKLRVLRGGSWYDDADGARSACRDSYPPSDHIDTVGFRLASTP